MAPELTVGARLAQARRERQLSLSDVTRQTKIQPWVLEALEADRLPGLMSPIYVKGFLTTYAKFLHLAPEPLAARLVWPRIEPEQEVLPPPSPPPTFQWSWRVPWPLLRRLSAAAATAILIGVIITKLPLKRPQAAAKAAKAKPAKTAAAPAPTAKAAPPPQLAAVAPVRELSKPPSPPTLTLLASEPLELAVTASSSTWLQVRADGKLVAQQRLPRGATERWTARKRLELIVAKPSQVALTLNGEPISAFAITHQGRLLITHQGVTALPEGR